MDPWRQINRFAYPVRVNADGVIERYINGAWSRPAVHRDRNGGACVSLKGKRGKSVSVPCGRLVMEGFIGKIPPATYVLHVNGNKEDQRLCNLRFAVSAECGRTGGRRRPTRPVCVCSEDGTIERFESVRSAARAYGVHERSVSGWCAGKWRTSLKGKRFVYADQMETD